VSVAANTVQQAAIDGPLHLNEALNSVCHICLEFPLDAVLLMGHAAGGISVVYLRSEALTRSSSHGRQYTVPTVSQFWRKSLINAFLDYSQALLIGSC